jgi:hypothetical protein
LGDAYDAAGPTREGEGRSLMTELRALGALHDPVPTEVVLAARSAIACLRMDAELAELVDSAPPESNMAGTRAMAPTLLIFETDGFAVELELLDEGGRRRLGGQLIPPEPGHVAVRHCGGTMEVVVDEAGRFVTDEMVAGPLSLRCTVGNRSIETDWFLA